VRDDAAMRGRGLEVLGLRFGGGRGVRHGEILKRGGRSGRQGRGRCP
jgi:hypothetical protein